MVFVEICLYSVPPFSLAVNLKMRKLKLRTFVLQRVAHGDDMSPSVVHEAYNTQTNQNKSLQAVSQMLKRMKIDKGVREAMVIENARAEAGKDILDYERVQAYISKSDDSGTLQTSKGKQLKCIRQVWELMGKTNPNTWTETAIREAIKKAYPQVENAQGKRVFEHPHAVMKLFGAVGTIFPSVMAKGYTRGLARPKGELFDYFRFDELNSYLNALEATPKLSKLGWQAATCCHVTEGSREGTNGETGLLGMRWEDINFQTHRTSIREKGGHGQAGRAWKNVPLDFLFPWLNTWGLLMAYHEELGKPYTGKVWDGVTYDDLLDQFNRARHAAGGRIAEEKETFTPHIFRKTHAQYLKHFHVPLEVIAGKFPNGWYGVGWDNINILKDTYTEVEQWEYEEADAKLSAQIKAAGLA